MKRAGKACCRAEAVRWLQALAFLLAAALCALTAPPARAQVALHIEHGAWLAGEGGTYDVPPPPPVFASAQWTPTPLPFVLPRTVVPLPGADPVDVVWLRLELPAGASRVEPGNLRLYLPRWQTVGQIAVYADDRLVFRSDVSPVWNGFNRPLWLGLDADGQRPRSIYLRVDHARSVGAAISTAWVGDAQGLGARRWWRQAIQVDLPFVAATTYLMIGLFAALVWLVRRESAYGFFALTAVLIYLRALHYQAGLEPFLLPDDWFGWMTVLSLFACSVVVNIFGLRLHGQRKPRTEAIALGVVLLVATLSIPPLDSLSIAKYVSATYIVAFVVDVWLTVVCMVSAWKARSRDTLVVMALNALTLPAAVHDWLLQNHRISIEGIYLLPIAGMALVTAFLGLVVRRYVQAIRRAEHAQAELERELRLREEELTQSHALLREIEHRQILNDERQRLMQDMHDGLGASLMGALKSVESQGSPAIADVLRQCLDDLKLTIDSLEQVEPDLLLLLATLRFRLGNRLQQAGLQLRWEVQDVPPLEWLEPRSALHILRILQEVLTNVARHSGARTVVIETAAYGDQVSVSMTDDGHGFDVNVAEKAGRGLSNVRRRAEAVGGRALWESGPGGTHFTLQLPGRRH